MDKEQLKSFVVTVSGFDENKCFRPCQKHYILATDQWHARDEVYRVLEDVRGWVRLNVLRVVEEIRKTRHPIWGPE
jgi:hypothetical protein